MDMPNYLDYGKMMEMNPMAYQQATDQLSLAKQFQAEKQKQAEAKSLADMMANDQSSKLNPMLLEAQGQINAGRGMDNQTKGMELDRSKATHQQQLTLDQREMARKLTDADFKEADQHIERMLRSGDQNQIQEAIKAQQYLPALLAEKRKHEREMEKTKYEQQQETGRSLERNQTTLEAARIGAQSRTDVAGMRGAKDKGAVTIEERVQAGKMSPAQAAVAFHGAAMTTDDPEKQQLYSRLAAQYETLAKQIPAAANAGKIDTPAVANLPAMQLPSAFGGGQPPPAANKPQHNLADLKAMYPGKSDAEIKAAYKRKFGVDL